MKISAATARKLIVHCQGLDGRWRLPKGKEGVAQAIERLGYVQIDTIAVVERAHHHTLWSRCRDYAAEMLHELQAKDRRVFEGWTHAASYLPMAHCRYYASRTGMLGRSERTRRWVESHRDLVRHVLDRIRDEGPLGSADFKAPDGRKRGPWWDWKPAKHALEVLVATGELMVSYRVNFQRMYDLTERVLPAHADTAKPTAAELAHFVARRALATQGVVCPDQARPGWRLNELASQALQDLVDAGEAVPVQIRGREADGSCACAAALDEVTTRRSTRKRLHILSPFDSCMVRRRLRDLFNFDYRLECYVPAAKRQHGYFCLPILWGTQFVGRLDPKAERKARTLTLRSLAFEAAFKNHDRILPHLAKALAEFAAFNQCERIVVERTEPKGIRAALSRALQRAR